jgi:hypothetical protein
MLLASACAERRVSAAWSLPPRNNLLSRILEQPMDDRWLMVRINSAVAALQAVALARADPKQCDNAPFAGCEYDVRLAMILGNRLDCEANTYRVTEAKEGLPIVIRVQSAIIACPPPESR